MTIRMVYVLYVLPSGLVVWVSLVAAMLEVARSDTAAHVAIRAAVSRHGAVRIPIYPWLWSITISYCPCHCPWLSHFRSFSYLLYLISALV